MLSFKVCFLVFIFQVFASGIGVNSQNTNPPLATQCLDCTANKEGDGDCIHNPRQDRTCSTSGYCFIHLSDEGVVRRGCVNDTNRYVQRPEDCDGSDKCVVCSNENKCNRKDIREEHCIQIEYTAANAIVPNASLSISCPVTLETHGCYHLERNGSIIKGCMSSLSKQAQNDYKNSKDTEICIGTNCNSKVVRNRKCAYCYGSTYANCADTLIQSNTIDCSYKSNLCITGIDKNGYTHRDCATNHTHDAQRFPNGFENCENDQCNLNEFPENRLKCFQCQANGCSFRSVEAEIIRPKTCSVFSKSDQCYTYFGKDGNVFRGCASDYSENRKSCEQDNSNCFKCGTSGCNNQTRNSSNNVSSQSLFNCMMVLAILFGLQLLSKSTMKSF